MRQTETISGFAEELKLIRGLVVRFGSRAENLMARHDAGFPSSLVRESIAKVLQDLDLMGHGGLDAIGCDLSDLMGRLRTHAFSTWKKSLGRIAGGAMISLRFRDTMSEDGRRRAFAAEVVYECLQDLLDDLVDAGGYTFTEALRLFRQCLRCAIEPDADFDALPEDLGELMGPGQEDIAELLVGMSRELNGLLRGASRILVERFARANEALSIAQAATVFQQIASFDRSSLVRIAETLPAPEPGFTWIARMATNISWPSNLAMIDLMFSGDRIAPDAMESYIGAWTYLNAVVTFLDHFAHAKEDSNEGIVNLARLFVGADALGLGPARTISTAERERIFDAVADLVGRGIAQARCAEDDASYYALLAIMIPVVTLVRDEDLEAYARTLMPRLRGDLAAEDASSVRELSVPVEVP